MIHRNGKGWNLSKKKIFFFQKLDTLIKISLEITLTILSVTISNDHFVFLLIPHKQLLFNGFFPETFTGGKNFLFNVTVHRSYNISFHHSYQLCYPFQSFFGIIEEQFNSENYMG